MGERFLNERLAVAGRFRPGEDGAAAAESKSPAASADAPSSASLTAGASPPVRELVQTEENGVMQASIEDEAAELQKRHSEVMHELRDALAILQSDSARVSAQLELFKRQKDVLAALELGGHDLALLRVAKREIQTTHIELVKFERERTARQQPAQESLAHLSFRQLTRVGLGLTWPVILALLAGAGLIVATLMRLFFVTRG